MSSFCLAVLGLVSAAAPAAGPVIDEDAFVLPILDGSPAQRLISEPLRRAEAALMRARAPLNPRVEAGQEAPEQMPRQTTVALAWTPPLDGRRGLAVDAARAGVDAARARSAVARLALELELREVFANWALTVARRDVLASHTERASRLTEQVAARSRVGEESGLAARRLGLAEAELRAELAQAKAGAARADAVARAWRPDLDRQVRPERPRWLPPSEGGGVARPGLDALTHDVEQARFEERLSRRFWIFPELQVGWQRLAVAGNALTGPVFGIGVAVPLFDRNQGGRLETTARREAAEARLALGTARINAQLAGAREAYAGLVVAAAQAEDVAAGSDRVVEAAAAAFRAGEATVTDLLDTLRAAREAQTRALDMQAAALAARRQLEAVRAGLADGALR